MLSVAIMCIMLSVIMEHVVMLSVVAPRCQLDFDKVHLGAASASAQDIVLWDFVKFYAV